MTRIRRALAVTGLAVAVTMGLAIPAWAAFTDTVAVQSSVTTASVAPVTGVGTQEVCFWGQRVAVHVWWTPSATDRVSGYTVTAYRSDGRAQVVTDVTRAANATHYFPSGTVAYSVTTHTEYGWTATSAPSGVAARC